MCIIWLVLDNKKNSYYCCKCYCFNDKLILCEECSKWVDDVETCIAKHLNEFKPVVNARRLKNNKKNKMQNIIMFVSIFIIE